MAVKERVLVVDDEPEILRFCARVLGQEGYEAHTVDSGREACERLAGESFSLLLVDIKMPEEIDPSLPAVVITGYATLETAVEALNAGARGFLLKPFGIEELVKAVRSAREQARREAERVQLRAQVPILEIGQALLAEGDLDTLSDRLLDAVATQWQAERAARGAPGPG